MTVQSASKATAYALVDPLIEGAASSDVKAYVVAGGAETAASKTTAYNVLGPTSMTVPKAGVYLVQGLTSGAGMTKVVGYMILDELAALSRSRPSVFVVT